MAQTVNANSPARAAALQRRRAMSTTGKTSLKQANPVGSASSPQANTVRPAGVAAATVGRNASRERRRAMSSHGKGALIGQRDRVRADDAISIKAGDRSHLECESVNDDSKSAGANDCTCGCKVDKAVATASLSAPVSDKRFATRVGPQFRNRVTVASTARSASKARRQAMSQRGKSGIAEGGMSAAQTARAANPHLSARELASALRKQRSRNGRVAGKKSEPCGRTRPRRSVRPEGAQDAHWKVGYSETAHGQGVTGTMVGRSERVTGDEPSTCRTVTGTEYLGADIFERFCATDYPAGPRKTGISPTSRGNTVSGSEVGRSGLVTGNEPGSCKRVTGDEYVGAADFEHFCDASAERGPGKITRSQTRRGKSVTGDNVGRSGKVTGDESGADREPTGTQYMQRDERGRAVRKVGVSETLRGGRTTGTLLGRNANVTGSEAGACRHVTGDDYVSREEYAGFCDVAPAPDDRKVGVSRTLGGKPVSGTMTGRSSRVTGDEPGTCKAITGTPYAGVEQYGGHCRAEESALALARTRQQRATPAMPMTGQQPGIEGKMTGAGKGACQPLSGTPYVGADQYADACPATPAEPGGADFPQSLGEMPWGDFSVEPPAHASQRTDAQGAVTGTRYEAGHITGPFGMAGGKVTGTEEFRHGAGESAGPATPPTAAMVQGRVKSRITGEGMDSGLTITGDDWDRGDNVTGTEGMSAQLRNPTRRPGPIGAMSAARVDKRNEELPEPVSRVTGGSGNTEKGAFVTYSGGARG